LRQIIEPRFSSIGRNQLPPREPPLQRPSFGDPTEVPEQHLLYTAFADFMTDMPEGEERSSAIKKIVATQASRARPPPPICGMLAVICPTRSQI
jgi:hypothetical protein